MDPIEYAKHLLVYYFEIVFDKAGLPWDSDNVVEVEGIVDSIVEAARADRAN
jgi:hypothetical protein